MSNIEQMTLDEFETKYLEDCEKWFNNVKDCFDKSEQAKIKALVAATWTTAICCATKYYPHVKP